MFRLFSCQKKSIFLAIIMTICFLTISQLSYAQDEQSFESSGQFTGWVRDGVIHNNVVYVAEGYHIAVFDLSVPTFAPVKTVNIPNNVPSQQIVVDGSRLYIRLIYKLLIFDITDPLNPILQYEIDLGYKSASHMSVSGDRIFLARGSYRDAAVLDLSDPNAPVFHEFPTIFVKSVIWSGDMAYCLNASDQLQILDISDPTNPIAQGILEESYGYTIAASGNHVYQYGRGNRGLTIIDVSDPVNPQMITTHDPDGSYSDIFILGNRAYLSGKNDWDITWNQFQIYILDISDIANPVRIANFESKIEDAVIQAVGSSTDLYLFGTSIGMQPSIQVYDVTDAANPQLKKTYQPPTEVTHTFITGNRLYLSDRGNGLYQYDVTDPANPLLTNTYQLNSTDEIYQITGEADRLYTLDEPATLNIFDISDPATLLPLGDYHAGNTFHEMLIQNNHAYLLDREGTKLQAVDLTTPATPNKTSEINLPGEGRALTINEAGTSLFAAYSDGDTDHGLQVIDLANPNILNALGTVETQAEPAEAIVKGDTLYIVSNDTGWFLEAFDISDPANPIKITETSGTGKARDLVSLHDSTVMISISNQGLAIFTLYESGFSAGPIQTLSMATHMSLLNQSAGTNQLSKMMWDEAKQEYIIVIFIIIGEPYYGTGYEYMGRWEIRIVIYRYKKKPAATKVNLTMVVMPPEAADDDCTTNPAPGVHEKNKNDDVSLLAIPNEAAGWNFQVWSGDASGDSPSTTIKMDKDKTAIANFVRPTLTLKGGKGLQYISNADDKRIFDVLEFDLTASEEDDWMINKIQFDPYGTGNETTSIATASLYFLDPYTGWELTDFFVQVKDDVDFSLDVDRLVPANQSRSFRLEYTFVEKIPDETSIIETFSVRLKCQQVTAHPITYAVGLRLPPPDKPPIIGGPIQLGRVWNVQSEKAFDHIQDAIKDGETLDTHTLLVCPGDYFENVEVNKSLIIKSTEGRFKTKVQGKTMDEATFNITVDNVTIQGFHITGMGSGIWIHNAQNCIIGVTTNATMQTLPAKTYPSPINPKQLFTTSVSLERNVISGNSHDGISINGSRSKYNKIRGNLIGTDPKGDSKVPNGLNGISITSGSENTIGGLIYHTSDDGFAVNANIVSGNSLSGIEISGANNKIFGNIIGTNFNKDYSIANRIGICINFTHDNQIGGAGVGGYENVIVGHDVGIKITGENSRMNKVMGNVIGFTKPTYEPFMKNIIGIEIANAPDNIIGGSEPNAGNTISGNEIGIYLNHDATQGNKIKGNYIGTDKSGQIKRGNEIGIKLDNSASHNTIGGTVNVKPDERCFGDANLISGNKEQGILIDFSCSNNQILGNFIGTDDTGTEELGNKTGIQIDGSSNNTIGGVSTNARNLISGNTNAGIFLAKFSSNTKILANFIGTDKKGASSIGNHTGIQMEGASNNTIGNGTMEGRNLISGNKHYGILITKNATNNTILTNIIGAHWNGQAKLGNKTGIQIEGSSNNHIGNGTFDGINQISGNSDYGISLIENASNNTIKGNYIGTDLSGLMKCGNIKAGIYITSANNTIGGMTSVEGNVISGNNWGVYINGKEAKDNHLRGNFIGVDKTGAVALANDGYGIIINNGLKNTIGATTSNAPLTSAGGGNIISANDLYGVFITGNKTKNQGNRVIGNFIGCGIDGTKLLPNTKDGIKVEHAEYNEVIKNRIMGHHSYFSKWAGIHLLRANRTLISQNTLANNFRGLWVIYSKAVSVFNNKMKKNHTGFLYRYSTFHVGGNDVEMSLKFITGLHITGSHGTIIGNRITDNAGAGIMLDEGSQVVVADNNIYDNENYGLQNDDPTVIINAQNNWWGDAVGPGGEGPGSGDAVSGNVDFSGWCEEPVTVIVSAPNEGVIAEPNSDDSTVVLFRNWENQEDVLDVTVTDELGWLQEPTTFDVALDTVLGGSAKLKFMIPGNGGLELQNKVWVTAASQSTPTHTDIDSFLVLNYTPQLAQIEVTPDTAVLAPGDSVHFIASGFSQNDIDVLVNPIWTATGGIIDSVGLYIAGMEEGTFTVTAADSSGLIEGQGIVVIDAKTVIGTTRTASPYEFKLFQNSPNPFNPETTIRFAVNEPCRVELKIYDVMGREVQTLVDSQYAIGLHQVSFEAGSLSSGIYFYRIQMKDYHEVKKMVLLE